MLKRLIAISLLIALLGSGFSRFFVYAGFEINSKYIAENLCVNKSRPSLHCEGKCYLMKKLKQAAEKEKKQEREDMKSRYQQGLPAFVFYLKFQRPISATVYPKLPVPQTVGRSISIFQPPKIALQQV